MASFQTGASLAKTLFPVFGALGTVSLRVGLAALVLCAMWRPWRLRPERRAVIAIFAYGVSLGAMNACFYQALARLPLGVAVAIESLGPFAVALSGSRRSRDLIWVAMAAAGLLLLVNPDGTRALDTVGVFFAGAAAVCWAAYILSGVRLSGLMPAGPATAFGMLVAACFLVPAGSGSMGPLFHSTRFLGLSLGVAMLSSALPYTLELAAMRRMSARGFGILMSLEPAVAALSGLMLLGERLAAARWIGILLIVAACTGSVTAGERD